MSAAPNASNHIPLIKPSHLLFPLFLKHDKENVRLPGDVCVVNLPHSDAGDPSISFSGERLTTSTSDRTGERVVHSGGWWWGKIELAGLAEATISCF